VNQTGDVADSYEETIANAFSDLFGEAAMVTASSPGRVNLIGEHTDYNDGFVLPAALPLRTTVELRPRQDGTVRVWSAQYAKQQPQSFSLESITRAGDWTDYVRGITWVLLDHGLTSGFDARVSSEIPLGSGLSSSAALLIRDRTGASGCVSFVDRRSRTGPPRAESGNRFCRRAGRHHGSDGLLPGR
jgi:galactokinase